MECVAEFFAICAFYGTLCSSNLITFQTYKLKYTSYKRMHKKAIQRKWNSAFPKLFFSMPKNDSPRELWNMKCEMHLSFQFGMHQIWAQSGRILVWLQWWINCIIFSLFNLYTQIRIIINQNGETTGILVPSKSRKIELGWRVNKRQEVDYNVGLKGTHTQKPFAIYASLLCINQSHEV